RIVVELRVNLIEHHPRQLGPVDEKGVWSGGVDVRVPIEGRDVLVLVDEIDDIYSQLRQPAVGCERRGRGGETLREGSRSCRDLQENLENVLGQVSALGLGQVELLEVFNANAIGQIDGVRVAGRPRPIQVDPTTQLGNRGGAPGKRIEVACELGTL